MRYQSIFVVDYDCGSDDEALRIAFEQHRELHDMLRIEGPDEPSDVRLERLLSEGRDLLSHARVRQINP